MPSNKEDKNKTANVEVPPREGISSMQEADKGPATYGNDGPGPNPPVVKDKAEGSLTGPLDHIMVEKAGQSKKVESLEDVTVNNEHPTSVARGFVDPHANDAAALKWIIDMARYMIMRAEEHLNDSGKKDSLL